MSLMSHMGGMKLTVVVDTLTARAVRDNGGNMRNESRSVERQIHGQYTLLQAELYAKDAEIEANMDADPGAWNPEAKDIVLRKERQTIITKMNRYKV